MRDYFDPPVSAHAVLLWAVATRAQLGRWESLSADRLAQEVYKIPFPEAGYWQGHYEWHFCLIAARNLLGALDLLDPPLAVDQVLRDEITETRGLNEHWKENMPVFNVRSRPGKLHKTGQSFAARNPAAGPYCWWAWNGKDGPLLTPHVPATAVHELIDRAEARVLGDHPDLEGFVPPRGPSPWLHDRGEWWPVNPAPEPSAASERGQAEAGA